jgi:hypothetical protein
MAVNEQWLFLGMEVGSEPRASPLAAVAKAPLTTIPTRRWVPDEISVAEIEARLSSMTVKERANFWFFSGNPERTVSLLAPDGTPAESADAESLFLLTFAHDSVGLDKPEEYERYFQLLSSRFPRSYFTELGQSVRPAPVVREAISAPTPSGSIAHSSSMSLVLTRIGWQRSPSDALTIPSTRPLR